MLRIRVSFPKREEVASYHHLDILHDALIRAWIAADAKKEQVLGVNALPWNFAALGRQDKAGTKKVHTLIVSTPDATLAKILPCLNPSEIRYARARTVEHVNFANAEITIEEDPILPNQNMLGVLMLSPLAIRDNNSKQKHWHKHLEQFDVSAAINHRLSRFAGHEVKLQVQPDSLFLRCNPDHSVLVPLKQMANGKKAFVIGMSVPLVLIGSDKDLRFAWYAGLGEKTRNGFGCIGLADQGIGK